MIKVEFNFDAKAIDKAIRDAVVEQVRSKILDSIDPADADKVTIKVSGKDVQSLSFDVSGPDDIIERVRQALA